MSTRHSINLTLPMLVIMALVMLVVQPEPETIINLLAVVWVIYAAFYVFMWCVGKFVMIAVRRGIRDGTLKFTVKKTEEKEDNGSSNR